MTMRVYIFLLLLTLFTSGLSAILLFFYMNPESDFQIAFILMGTAVFLFGSTFLALFIYFIKRIYYRGEVYMSTLNASLRQSTLMMIATITTIAIYSYNIFDPKLIALIWAAVICFEVMMQTLD